MNFLKSLMLVMMALTVANMTAANVDSQMAQAKAIQFLNSKPGTRFMASSANMKLAHAEKSAVNAKCNDYYVFNYEGGGYVIVSGDDRAEEILGYGNGTLDMNTIPSNLRWWLSQYKEQMEFLFKNPRLEVRRLSDDASTMLRATTVSPLLPCTWDQDAPYWNQCPSYSGSKCYTGCVATAMAQVMYYWKYPSTLPALPSYKTSSYNISVAALPGTTLDWDNMINDYYHNSYTTAQATAVATLMRYCGQSCEMDYGPDGSGAYSDDQLEGMKLFGYNSGATYVRRSSYSDSQWVAMMLEDLQAGRPILYGGDDGTYGHAFVVDGYNGSKFHVNWGWSGSDDDYYAISSFMIDSDYDFRQNQDMLYQVYPEGSQIETYAPVMADASNVAATSFKASWTDQTPSENVEDYTLYVQQYDPNQQSLLSEAFGGVTGGESQSTRIDSQLDNYCDNAGWTGSYVYPGDGAGLKFGNSSNGGSLTTPALDLSACGGTITVNFNAKTYNTDATTLTISCGNASGTVTLTGTATDYSVVLTGVTAAAGQKVTIASSGSKKRWYLYNVEIVAGAARNMFKATESGDASRRVITGITGKNYTVTGLNEGGSYKFYVEANYTDGSKKQSNVETVTLEGTLEPTPELIVDPETLTMTANAGETATATFNVLGADLKGDVTLTVNDANGVYTINPTTISATAAEAGANVTVTYAPTTTGTHEATITVATEGAEAVTVTLNGTATIQTTAPVMTAATNVAQTSFTATWTDATAAQYVKDYTLYVNRVGATGTALMTETFDKINVTKDGTYDRAENLDEYCDNAGWTGYAVYEAVGGGIKLGSGSKLGYVTTPALDLTNCGGSITVSLNAKSYGSDNTSIKVTCGDVTQTVQLTSEATDYQVVLTGVTAAAGQKVTIESTTAGKRFYIYNAVVYSGEGAADSRVITGITAKTYTVEGLTAGETYEFYVEANYADDSKAASNHEQVTLLAPAPVPTIIVDNETIEMSAAVLGTVTATIDVLASDLKGDVTVTLNDETGLFTVTPATISASDAQEGTTITVTYAPTVAGEHTATITLSSEGAEDVILTINATAAMETLAPEMQPAAEELVTTTTFRADWVDVTPEEYVKDYTLYVNKKQDTPAGATLLSETFGGVEGAPEEDSNIDIADTGSLDDFLDNAGWTGYGVYLAAQGGVKLGSSNKVGYLTSPALDLSNCSGTVTVKFSAKSYGSDGSSMTVSCGEVSQTVELTTEVADYTVVLTGVPALADQQVTLSGIANKKRFYLYQVTIIGGEESAARAITEIGDADSRVITGITDQYYVVENLTPGATYTYYVEANYIDGTKAASNVETVTLLVEQGHDYQLGDVNHDGAVTIQDATVMIDYLLSGSGDICPICADIDGDEGISIADVTMLIDNLLSGN